MTHELEQLGDRAIANEDQAWAEDLFKLEYGEIQAALADHLRFSSQIRHPKRRLWISRRPAYVFSIHWVEKQIEVGSGLH